MNYEAIKTLAKQRSGKITDYIALAPNNDPFYVGTPSDLEKGAWFAALWQQFGFTHGVHIRRVHYRIISQQTPVLMPNGLPYENTEGCWDFLNNASKAARYLGLVDPSAFVDRRNPDPHVFLYTQESNLGVGVESEAWGASEFPPFPDLPDYTIDGYQGTQNYHIELWCEKSTMNDVLLPLCQRYGANLVTGAGELSITAVLELTHRINHRPVRIFYISDFDPAGQSMPCAVARKIEFFLSEHSIEADIKLFPLVLTVDQVQQFRLPRTPLKESERRGAKFEERYGAGAVELDALEALYPGTLRTLIATEIERYFDTTLANRVAEAKWRLADELDNARNGVLEVYADQLDSLRAEHAMIQAEFAQRMNAYGQQVERLWQAISDDLDDAVPDLEQFPIPEARKPKEINDPLFDSSRDYLSQLSAYKAWQGKAVTQ